LTEIDPGLLVDGPLAWPAAGWWCVCLVCVYRFCHGACVLCVFCWKKAHLYACLGGAWLVKGGCVCFACCGLK